MPIEKKYVVAAAIMAIACCTACSGSSDSAVDCPEGAALQGGICLYDCPEGWARNAENRCAPPCPSGFSAVDGACARPCPSGTFASGVLCIPDIAGLGPAECTDVTYDESGATGEAVYVNGDGSDLLGDGSLDLPLGSLGQALENAAALDAPDVSVIFGPGEYQIDVTEITMDKSSLRLLGVCPSDTRFVLAPGAHIGLNTPGAEVEIARIGFTGGAIPIYIESAADVSVRDATFEGWDGGLAAIYWNGSDGSETLVVENAAFSGGSSPGVSIGGLAQADVVTSMFSSDANEGALISYDVADLRVSYSTFEGSGQTAVSVDFTGTGGTARLENCSLEGDWNDAVRAVDSSGSSSALELSGVSVNSSSGSAGIRINDCLEASLSDVRVTGGSQIGIAAYGTDSFSVEGSTVAGTGEYGIWTREPGAAEILGSYVSGATAAGVVRELSPTAEGVMSLLLDGSVVTGCQRGIDVEQGALIATGNAIGANASVGIKVRLATGISITGNVLASNYSTGIDLVSLAGAADAVYAIENNTVMESAGLGLSARSCGDGTISILGNDIYGTLAGDVTNAGQAGELGDGIGILTGTDGVPSKARITGNAVGGNIRLGIIVDGVGTEAEVSENDFLDGNGYGRSLDDLVDSTPDLLHQDQAAVSGADASVAQEVFGVYVSDDPGAAPPVFHGGGEPTHN